MTGSPRDVAVAADVEERVDAGDVVAEARRHALGEEVHLRGDDSPRGAEPQRVGLRDESERRGRAADRQDALIDVRVVPHERRLEVVVVAVPMDGLQRGHAEKVAGQRVQQVVVELEAAEAAAEGERERQRLVLQLVVGEREELEAREAPDVGGNAVEVVVLERERAHADALEELEHGRREG